MPTQESTAPPTPIDLSTLRVLVVDDHAHSRHIMCGLLTELRCSVAVAVDGSEALKMLRSGSFDAVISDVNMRPLNGLTMLRHIRHDPELLHLVVILMSRDPFHLGKAMDDDADSFLDKCFTAQAIDRYTNVSAEQSQALQLDKGTGPITAEVLGLTLRNALKNLRTRRPGPPSPPTHETGSPDPASTDHSTGLIGWLRQRLPWLR